MTKRQDLEAFELEHRRLLKSTGRALKISQYLLGLFVLALGITLWSSGQLVGWACVVVSAGAVVGAYIYYRTVERRAERWAEQIADLGAGE